MRKSSVKTILSLILIGILALISVGCGNPDSQTTSSDQKAKSPEYKLEYKKLYYDTGKLYYEGEARPGKWGTIHYAGDWIPYGKGKIYYFEGDLYYDGEIKDGWRSGAGKSYAMDGTLDYIGEWKNDSPMVTQFNSGTYTLYYADGKSKFYEGQWKNGVREGQGVTYYRNGVIEHEGGYRAGMRDGEGKYYNRDGTICYVGSFKEGVPCGSGKIYDNNKWNPLEQKYQIDYKALAKELINKIQGE